MTFLKYYRVGGWRTDQAVGKFPGILEKLNMIQGVYTKYAAASSKIHIKVDGCKGEEISGTRIKMWH